MAFPYATGCIEFCMYGLSTYTFWLNSMVNYWKKLPVPWIRFRVFPKKHSQPLPRKNKRLRNPQRNPPIKVLASAGKPIRCRLAFIMISRKASGRLGAVGGQSDFAGGPPKKKTKGKHESILTSNINLHEIMITYTYHIISLHIYSMYTWIQLYIYMYLNMYIWMFHQFASVVNSSSPLTKIANYPWWRSYCTKLGCLEQ